MNPDFVDLPRALRDAEVRFMVVGAYALANHSCANTAACRACGDSTCPESGELSGCLADEI